MEALPQESIRKCVFTNCQEDALTLCKKCGKWYCLEHASDLDPTKYCHDCLLLQDAALEFAPLTDAEGTRHLGKVIRPVGVVFAQNSKLIDEMSEDELKDYIKYYQQAVHDCERSLDYARITLGNALYVAADKQLAKVKRETGEIVFISRKVQAPAKRARVAKTSDENAIVDFISKHLTAEQLAKFLAKKKGA